MIRAVDRKTLAGTMLTEETGWIMVGLELAVAAIIAVAIWLALRK